MDLAAAGRVEGGAVENDGWARSFGDVADFGVEVVEEGVVIVKAFSHGKAVILLGCGGLAS